jgi:CBS domain-containing protein
MRAADIMSSPVITAGPDASVIDAVRLMLRSHVSGLPVVAADGTLAASSPRAICCAGSRPIPNGITRAGPSCSAPARWPRNIPGRTAAKCPRS